MGQNLLGVKINYVTMYQAIETVSSWLQKKGKHYVVTPNPEMLVDARFDKDFRQALNGADMAIPDSSRLGWGSYIASINNPILRLIYAPFFLFPQGLPRFSYPKTSGIDLMESLLSLSEEKAYTTAYLGGSKRVADKLFKCLRLKYPKLKIVFCAGNMQVNKDGDIQFDNKRYKMTGSKEIRAKFELSNTDVVSKNLRSSSRFFGARLRGEDMTRFNLHILSQKVDIMFVAFGHRKQEKWMFKNLPKLNTRVMIGVGGSFDYISGEVTRAPQKMRQLGLEWLFRLMIQPWRVKRFWKLFYFIWLVLTDKES